MASLTVYPPNGERGSVAVARFPFRIGRQPENELVLTDQRISREHAQITYSGGSLVIEDLGSRHGLWVNGSRVSRHLLITGDAIEFGVENSYRLVFEESGGVADPLARLRDVLEVVRSLQATFEPRAVLDSVVDAALRIIGAERGFLFLRRSGGGLDIAAARDDRGAPLDESSLRVPRRLIDEAFESRREAFAMNYDSESGAFNPGQTVLLLDLRSSVFVPLPRAGGMLYFDSRAEPADLAMGNRELLETLALEASAVIESTRSIEEQRRRRKLEEELSFAREIQQSLLPRALPKTGWLSAAGTSRPSRAVGGDYFDVIKREGDNRAVVMADVSGKGLSAALLASLLQGALLVGEETIQRLFRKLNDFLLERTQGEKYATMFYALLTPSGEMTYANAGHCAPLVIRTNGSVEVLRATGVPIGLIEDIQHGVERISLNPGDKLVAYSDGFAENLSSDHVREYAQLDAAGLEAALLKMCSPDAPEDDQTLLVVEFKPNSALELKGLK